MMQEAEVKFLQESFKKYYFDHSELIQVIGSASKREFGYQKFNSGMNRHITIKDNKELHLLLMQNVPSDVYCSNACYTFPSMSMNEKDWQEAELIFDIDAKDLNLPCRKDHTVFICNQCDIASSDGKQCCKCSGIKFEKKSLPCKYCINASKTQVERLSEILIKDLGVLAENIHVYFSGNEGFHVYVYDSQFQKSSSKERSDIVDYIMFKGAVAESFGMKKIKPKRSDFPDFDEKGWRGRFAKHVFGSKSNRSKIITQLTSAGYNSFSGVMSDAFENIGVKIDPNVTIDIHRIFRLPGSLNSKSGLAKIPCDNLKDFDPYLQACLLGDDSVKVLADCPIQFSLKNKKFGPYLHKEINVPIYAAVYMICKKLAKLA